MRHLIELLLQNPWLLLIIVPWLLGAVGKVLGGAGKQATKAAEAAREEARRRLRQGVERRSPEAEEAERGAEPPQRRRITQAEAMAEMRRLLGTQPGHDAGTISREEQRQHQVAVVPAEGSRLSGEKQRRLGQVDVHVDPHVGEALQQRRTPASGRVGQADLGTLGGRTAAQAQTVTRTRRGLVDVHDIKRMLIMREVLGPPLALRPDWGPGQFS